MSKPTLAVGLCLVLSCPVPALAGNWPMARHDPQRTALASGTTDITTPGTAWRYYLGGSLTATQNWAGPIDTSGQNAIVFTAGGRLVAKRADDTLLWQSAQLGLNAVVDVWDVDGDGTLDVVATGGLATLAIFSTKDGSLEWALPASAGIATQGQVRTADLNGDGQRDIYVADCGCCTEVGTNGAVAYSFASGFAAAQQLWTIPPLGCSAGDLVADINGDGTPDVLRLQAGALVAYNGKTGAFEFESTPGADGSLEAFFGSALSAPGPGPIPFAIYFQNTYYGSANVGGERVLSYAYSSSAQALQKQWEVDAASTPADGQVAYDASSVGQFDSTGAWEVAVSFEDLSSGVWTLEVLDGTTGLVVASQSGARYQGAADVDGDGIPEILATASGGLTAFKLQRASSSSTGSLAAWSAAGGAVTASLDRTLAQWEAPDEPVATTPLSDGGANDLLLTTPTNPLSYEAVNMSAQNSAGSVVASFQAPANAALFSTNLFLDPTTQLPQPYLALSTGFLDVLDPRTLQPTNVSTSTQFPLNGMRTGGYYSGAGGVASTAVAASFTGGGPPSVVCESSNGELVRLDPGTSASVATPPSPTWAIPNRTYPSLVDLTGDGSPEIVAHDHDAGVVYATGSDGTSLLWRTGTGGVTFDLPFGDANGDGIPDIFYEYDQAVGEVQQMDVLDGKTGLPLWAEPFSQSIIAGISPIAVADMTGDGVADAVSATNNALYVSGASGTTLASNATVIDYDEPLLADVLDAGLPQAYLHGGIVPPRLDLPDAGTAWLVQPTSASEHWTGAYAALAPCDGGSVFVEGEFSSPLLHAYSTATGAEVWSTTLVGGQEFADAGSIPPGAYLGSLGNVTVKQDLTGTGHMDALVGSTDGYLYAVQACNGGALDWAYGFGSPVGEPIVADAMGTGKDQILVSVADGYLYDLAQSPIQPPAWVYAVDPPAGEPHTPVSTIETKNTLYAEWDTVPDATGYQWAVYTSAGLLVGMTGYQTQGYTPGQLPDGGAVIDVTASGLPLVDGGRYYFAVRAVNANGPSGDAVSNTVTVLMPMDGGTAADGGVGGGSPDGGPPDGGMDGGSVPPVDGGVDGGVADAGTVDGGADAGGFHLPSPPNVTLDGGSVTEPTRSCCGCGSGGGTDLAEDLLGVLLAMGTLRRRSRGRSNVGGPAGH